jgi:hypothetical protein
MYDLWRAPVQASRQIIIKQSVSGHSEKVRIKSIKTAVMRAAAILLVVSLAGFVTLARNAQYLPQSNPARYLSIASKMKVSPKACVAPVELQPALPGSLVRIPEPLGFVTRVDRGRPPLLQRIDINICLPQRAPPSHLS